MIETNQFNCEPVGAHDCTQKISRKTVGAGPVSAHTSKAIQNKGITLIALVITIVVMLILVGVTINIAVNGGLFQQAGKAVSDTQNAINAEQTLASGEIKIGDSWYDSMSDYLKGIESVKSLQEKHEFEYYSSFSKAIVDANNNTKANADVDKEEAVAGIYTENDKNTVVLLKDTTENGRVVLSADMTINLGGNTLIFENDYYGIYSTREKKINVTIDGKLKGSSIVLNGIDGGGVIISARIHNFKINGGTYTIYETTKNDEYSACAMAVSSGGNLDISNCEIYSFAPSTCGVKNYGNSTIIDCIIKVYSNFTDGWSSKGIYNHDTTSVLTVNNCYVSGIESAITNFGVLYINGGTYEGVNVGISACEEGYKAYIENAIIRNCTMPEGYTQIDSLYCLGIQFRGTTNEGNNTEFYVNNCDIYGGVSSILLQGEYSNKIYISNSKINIDKNIVIRDNCKLYIGKGCNFTAEYTDNPSAVVVTEQVYTKTN